MSQEKPTIGSEDIKIPPDEEFAKFVEENGGLLNCRFEIKTKTGVTIKKESQSIDMVRAVFSIDDIRGASVDTVRPTTAALNPGRNSMDFFTSRDWIVDYAADHEDIPISKGLFNSMDGVGPSRNSMDSLLPYAQRPRPESKEQSGKTDWEKDYYSKVPSQRVSVDPLASNEKEARPRPEEKGKTDWEKDYYSKVPSQRISVDPLASNEPASQTQPKDNGVKTDWAKDYFSKVPTQRISVDPLASNEQESQGVPMKTESIDWGKDFLSKLSSPRVSVDPTASLGKEESTDVATTRPPQIHSTTTLWSHSLDPLIEAANLAKPNSVGEMEYTLAGVDPKSLSEKKKKKSRKVIPDDKEYVTECRDTDVLFGRGGRSNHHPGNKMYRDLVTSKQEYYRGCDKNVKTTVAQAIVDAVHRQQGGRFLEKDPDTNLYYVVSTLTARRKVGQALRENNTDEARAAKRQKYAKNRGRNSLSSSPTHPSSSSMAAAV